MNPVCEICELRDLPNGCDGCLAACAWECGQEYQQKIDCQELFAIKQANYDLYLKVKRKEHLWKEGRY